MSLYISPGRTTFTYSPRQRATARSRWTRQSTAGEPCCSPASRCASRFGCTRRWPLASGVRSSIAPGDGQGQGSGWGWGRLGLGLQGGAGRGAAAAARGGGSRARLAVVCLAVGREVVARREERDEAAAVHDLVALAHVLVRAYDEAERVGLAEGCGHVGAELGDVLAAARVVHAAAHHGVRVGRVGPQRVQRDELAVRVVQRARQLRTGRARGLSCAGVVRGWGSWAPLQAPGLGGGRGGQGERLSPAAARAAPSCRRPRRRAPQAPCPRRARRAAASRR